MATNEKCKITLDSPTNTYQSGSTIHGTISLLCPNKGKKIRGVYFKIIGYGKCGWTKIQQERSPPEQALPGSSPTPAPATAAKSEYSVQFSGTEEYLSDLVYLVGSKNGPGFEIPAGATTYEFQYHLKPSLPTTFKGTYGKIKYKLEFVVDRPWHFDEKYEVPFTVRHTVDLNADPKTAQPHQRQGTRNIGYLKGGPVSLHVYTPRSGCVTGGRLPLQVIVANNSSIHIDKVKFTLRQIIEYHSTTPAGFMRSECTKVMRKEAGGVEKKSEQKYEHVLEIPADLPATRTGNGIINVNYEIQVEAKVAGLFKNMVETIPLKIGTVPFMDDVRSIDPPLTNNNTNAASFPMPTPMPSTSSSAQSTPPLYPPMQMPMPYAAGHSSMPSVAMPYPSNPTLHTQPPNYGQCTSYPQSPFSRQSQFTGSMRSDSFVPSPSAPPLDFGSPNSTRSSVCSQQVWDTPPAYEHVFGAVQPASNPANPIRQPQYS